MKVAAEACNLLFITSCLLLITGLGVHSLPYDYSATTECMVEPQRAQYGGGIIVNPGFDHSIEGWTVFGKGAIEERLSDEGNRFIVARNRTQPLDSFSQKLSEGSDTVSVIFKINGRELIRGGHAIAKHGCWTLLKGGIVANFSSPAEILFEVKYILGLYLSLYQLQRQ
ncbi:Galactose-binding-like domain superfamily [Sesbania bispinosa]|nr:Galactose-binding-like domain superfamily [Sesbania bispinosa]